eukprot:3425011-Amphidinium_carterae.1
MKRKTIDQAQHTCVLHSKPMPSVRNASNQRAAQQESEAPVSWPGTDRLSCGDAEKMIEKKME